MALIGSLTTTGSMSSTVVDEARWKVANDDGTSPGSVSLVVQAGDFGNSHQRNASGSIIFVGKDGGSTNKAGSIVSKPYTNQDLIFSSSQSHSDIRFAVNDNGTMLNLLTVTAGRASGGLTAHQKPKVYITDNAGGYNRVTAGSTSESLKTRGRGLLTVVTETDVPAVQIIHTGTSGESALQVLRKESGTNGSADLLSVKNDETVVNESSNAYNFRVESNGQANMLLVDGTNDRVAIGSNAPMAPLDVNNMGGDHGVLIRNNDNSGVASQWVSFNTNNSSILIVTGSSSGQLRVMGCNDSDADSILELQAKTITGGNKGDSYIWFSSLGGNASTVTKHMYLGYDNSAGQVVMGESNSFGNNQRMSIGNGSIVFNEGSGDLDFRIESNGNTHAFFMDSTNGKIAIGDGTATNLSSMSTVTIEKTETDTWDSEEKSLNQLNHMDLTLRNKSNLERTFCGIAFDPSTEVDADSIGAAIIAERDGSSHENSLMHDTNLIFCTNTVSDDDLSERLRITHDGHIYASRQYSGATFNLVRTDGVIGSSDELGSIAFWGKEATDGMHHAIVSGSMYEAANIKAVTEASMAAGDSPSCLTFSTTPDGAAAATEKMRISALGLVGIGMTPSAGTLDITHSNNGEHNFAIKITGTAGGYSSNMIKMSNPDASATSMPIVGLFHQDDGTFTIGEAYDDTKLTVAADGDLTVAGNKLTVGTDADGTDRQVVFGHSTLKTVIGIDDSADVFAINTDASFETGNDLEIDSSGNVTLSHGSLTVGTVKAKTDSILYLKADLGVIVELDEDNDGSQAFIVKDGGDNELFRVEETGDVGIGVGGNASYNLHVVGNDSGSDIVMFDNQNTGTNADCLRLRTGPDVDSNMTTSNYFIRMEDGTGDDVGALRSDGSAGIQLIDAFTGAHPTVMPSEDYALGLIVESTGELWANHPLHVSTAIPKVVLSSTDSSKLIYGVIGDIDTHPGYVKKWKINEGESQVYVNGLGEGKVWVTNKDGNIENGDYITSSVIPGHGTKQSDDILRSCTVAKCVESVDWSTVTDTIDHNGTTYKKYLIGCSYHCS